MSKSIQPLATATATARGLGLALTLSASLLAIATVSAQDNAPPRSDPATIDFIFAIDVSRSTEKQAPTIRNAIYDFIFSGAGGVIRPGSTFSLWTYSDTVQPDPAPVRVWQPDDRTDLAAGAADFLRGRDHGGVANSEAALRALTRLSRAQPALTAFVVTDGLDGLTGTPFDEKINAVYREHGRTLRRLRRPFITTLVARNGQWLAWSIGAGGDSIEIPVIMAESDPGTAPDTPPGPPRATAAPESERRATTPRQPADSAAPPRALSSPPAPPAPSAPSPTQPDPTSAPDAADPSRAAVAAQTQETGEPEPSARPPQPLDGDPVNGEPSVVKSEAPPGTSPVPADPLPADTGESAETTPAQHEVGADEPAISAIESAPEISAAPAIARNNRAEPTPGTPVEAKEPGAPTVTATEADRPTPTPDLPPNGSEDEGPSGPVIADARPPASPAPESSPSSDRTPPREMARVRSDATTDPLRDRRSATTTTPALVPATAPSASPAAAPETDSNPVSGAPGLIASASDLPVWMLPTAGFMLVISAVLIVLLARHRMAAGSNRQSGSLITRSLEDREP